MAEGKPIESVADLQLDPKNANEGTERGRELLAESIDQCGLGRSIVVDKNGVVIAGNKTLEEARRRGVQVEVVQTTGEELVVVQRRDLDLVEQPRARQLAYYDNRVAELDLKWSPRQLKQDVLDGIDLSSSFFPEEVDKITFEEPPMPPATDAVEVAPMVDAPLPPAIGQPATPQAPVEPKLPKPPHPTFNLVFENITQQIRWTAFMRALREKYPDEPTQAARLSAYLTSLGITA